MCFIDMTMTLVNTLKYLWTFDNEMNRNEATENGIA